MADDWERPLQTEDVARAAVFMLQQPLNVSVKALDVVPSGKFENNIRNIKWGDVTDNHAAQRSLTVFDREWNSRQQSRAS